MMIVFISSGEFMFNQGQLREIWKTDLCGNCFIFAITCSNFVVIGCECKIMFPVYIIKHT